MSEIIDLAAGSFTLRTFRGGDSLRGRNFA